MLNEKPKAIFVFGTNGSGKSTIRQHLDLTGVHIIDPDLIAKEKQISSMQAGREAILHFKEYITHHQAFLMESTLSGNSVIGRVKVAQEAGFAVHIHFIGLENANLNKQRIQERVAKGGHYIEDATVERRFTDSVENLPKVLPFAHRITIYDNSEREAARQFLQVLKIRGNKIVYGLPTEKQPEWARKLVEGMKKDVLKNAESQRQRQSKKKRLKL